MLCDELVATVEQADEVTPLLVAHRAIHAPELACSLGHRERRAWIILPQVSSAAGFSGPMRTNLVRMLDGLDVPGLLGIASSADLFDHHSRHLRQSTSAIRHAPFIEGRNYTGSSPALVAVPLFRSYVFAVLAAELPRVPESIVIPMGRAVESALGLLRAPSSPRWRPAQWSRGPARG